MVCIETDAGNAICKIFDARPISKQKKLGSFVVRANHTVGKLFSEVESVSGCKNFDLSFGNLSLDEIRDKKLSDIGIKFNQSPTYRNEIYVTDIKAGRNNKQSKVENNNHHPITNGTSAAPLSAVKAAAPLSAVKEMKIDADIGISSDEDLALGASASPTESNLIPVPPVPPTFALPAIQDGYASSSTFKRNYDHSPITFVGLVNQAMTCYLNSLLQALFMTPEFRNALYNWEFDGKDEAKSIPYQLQKLFLNLQTSAKVAIETTDLTRSFGWDSSEAWQQHDIQELCRVMFDALENRFKNTKQSDLINRLYSGKMMDYVKCLDCGTEKSREDTFLDIPLPVRPFGSNIAYESVEEALNAFVQPETLDGNNQYFCEKCNRKCDAHKGLKFTKFPYILTLHLKRFDFDYQTLHRIKLNDKVTFPQTLNVNSFISNPEASGFVVPPQQNGISDTASIGQESGIESNSVTKCDDCSTTDSGSALEEDSCNGGTSIPSSGTNDQDLQEDDEGIDMGGGDATASATTKNVVNSSGPYIYELFAIMIHSGSASGGHYYAYIKDFETEKWYSFNDQTVSNITQEDIQKSFGGSSTKTYYSSAYSSSTNAYMLMYRQMGLKNVLAIKEENFPEHIKTLKSKMKEKEESDKKIKDLELEMTKLKVYFHNPKQKRLVDVKVYVSSDSTLEETLQEAYSRLAIKTIAPVENCRLVAFDHTNETIECSLEGKEQERICDVMNSIVNMELLLEVRDSNSEFEVYAPGGMMLKIYTIDMISMDIEGPLQLRVCKTDTIGTLKKLICNKYELSYEQILMVINRHGGNCSYPKSDDVTLDHEMLNTNCKIIVAINVSQAQQQSAETVQKLNKIVDDTFQHILTLYFLLPNTDKENLEKMLIPSYEPQSATTSPAITSAKIAQKQQQMAAAKSYDCVDAQCYANPVLAATLSCRIASPLPPMELNESNSEDSSLSDSDRTLVEAQAAQDDISSNSNSPAWSEPRLSSPEEWIHGTTTSTTVEQNSPLHQNYDDDMMNATSNSNQSLYFKALPYEEPAVWEGEETQKMIKVYTHKQLLIKDLKRELEPYVKVPLEYFKIFKMSVDNQAETECVRLTENLTNFKDGERLQIELGRALRDGEYKCKLYFLKLSEISDEMEKIPYLCETILRTGAEVGQTKREILAHIATLNPKYNIPYEKCRLRRKSYKNPSKIYFEDQKFGDDITLVTSFEMVLQEIESTSQPSTDDEDVVLFVRRWYPSTLTLSEFHEITIGPKDELKNVVSKMSGIPEDNLEYNKMTGNFPRCNTSLMSIQDLVWSSHQNHSISQDGSLFLYRDKTEPVKELSEEERRELTNKENTRMGITSSSTYTSNYSSRRRERALKIYIDPSPKKNEE